MIYVREVVENDKLILWGNKRINYKMVQRIMPKDRDKTDPRRMVDSIMDRRI